MRIKLLIFPLIFLIIATSGFAYLPDKCTLNQPLSCAEYSDLYNIHGINEINVTVFIENSSAIENYSISQINIPGCEIIGTNLKMQYDYNNYYDNKGNIIKFECPITPNDIYFAGKMIQYMEEDCSDCFRMRKILTVYNSQEKISEGYIILRYVDPSILQDNSFLYLHAQRVFTIVIESIPIVLFIWLIIISLYRIKPIQIKKHFNNVTLGIFASILPGLGHLLINRGKRAIWIVALLFVGSISYLIYSSNIILVAIIGFYIWSIYDAIKLNQNK